MLAANAQSGKPVLRKLLPVGVALLALQMSSYGTPCLSVVQCMRLCAGRPSEFDVYGWVSSQHCDQLCQECCQQVDWGQQQQQRLGTHARLHGMHFIFVHVLVDSQPSMMVGRMLCDTGCEGMFSSAGPADAVLHLSALLK